MTNFRQTALLLSMWTIASTGAAFADPNWQQRSQKQQFRPITADREYACEKLSQPQELPGVPMFTGRATFLSGLRYPNDRSGYRIGLTYAAVEDESQVLEWYKTGLTSYSWKLIDSAPDAKSITAVKEGNTFTVHISPNRMPGYRTIMVLSFKSSK